MAPTPDFHPMQVHEFRNKSSSSISASVALRAYEVYCALFGAQEAMVTDGCRGGFGAGELIAFLYARSFPKEEWRKRFDEGLKRKPD